MVRLQGAFHPTLAFFLGLSALIVLWIGSRHVIDGRLSIGDFVAFNAYVDDAELADDRLRMGDEHAAARTGRVAEDALHPAASSPSIRDRDDPGRAGRGYGAWSSSAI